MKDTLAEWLRRRPAKPVGSAREGSNPSGVVVLYFERNPEKRWSELLTLVRNTFRGDLAQMVERSLSMREALGSMPRFSSYFFLVSCSHYCMHIHAGAASTHSEKRSGAVVSVLGS